MSLSKFKGGRAVGGHKGWMRALRAWTVLLPLLNWGWATVLKETRSSNQFASIKGRPEAPGLACRLRGTLWDVDEGMRVKREHRQAKHRIGLGHLKGTSIII